jgi:hypothetical protein
MEQPASSRMRPPALIVAADPARQGRCPAVIVVDPLQEAQWIHHDHEPGRRLSTSERCLRAGDACLGAVAGIGGATS